MDKEAARQLIDDAVRQGRRSLSEYEAKRVLTFYDIPLVSEILVERKEGTVGQLAVLP
ncbi:MAG: hypothetical protein U5L07_00285 [Desulfobacterales bacterium]|nr:hypothetical protein [Desulfobacterales bacterium]